MLLLRERVVTDDGSVLEIELHDDLRYRLSWKGTLYESQKPGYAFRSVEQLRYDFERDAAKA